MSDLAGNSVTKTESFTLDTTVPSIESVDLSWCGSTSNSVCYVNNNNINNNNTITATLSGSNIAGQLATLSFYTIDQSNPIGNTPIPSINPQYTTTVTASATQAQFTIPKSILKNLPKDENIYVQISIANKAGNIGSNSGKEKIFKVDLFPPSVSKISTTFDSQLDSTDIQQSQTITIKTEHTKGSSMDVEIVDTNDNILEYVKNGEKTIAKKSFGPGLKTNNNFSWTISSNNLQNWFNNTGSIIESYSIKVTNITSNEAGNLPQSQLALTIKENTFVPHPEITVALSTDTNTIAESYPINSYTYFGDTPIVFKIDLFHNDDDKANTKSTGISKNDFTTTGGKVEDYNISNTNSNSNKSIYYYQFIPDSGTNVQCSIQLKKNVYQADPNTNNLNEASNTYKFIYYTSPPTVSINNTTSPIDFYSDTKEYTSGLTVTHKYELEKVEYRWGSSGNFTTLTSPYSIPDYNNNNLIGNKTLTVRVTDIFSRSSQAQQTIKFIDSEEPTNNLLSTSNVQNLYNKTGSNSITVKTKIQNSMILGKVA